MLRTGLAAASKPTSRQASNSAATGLASAGSLNAYTSVLHADRSPLGLAGDHRQTEAMLAGSGVPYALLRNGWYTENDMASVPAALAHDAVLGASRLQPAPTMPSSPPPC